MPKTAISTPDAPSPVARFSQGVRAGTIVQVAGQVGVDPATGAASGPDITSQTRQALANVRAILREAGAGIEDIVMIRVYLTDRDHFTAMNKVYDTFVTAPYPARTTVYVGLPPGLLIEIDALAVLDDH